MVWAGFVLSFFWWMNAEPKEFEEIHTAACLLESESYITRK